VRRRPDPASHVTCEQITLRRVEGWRKIAAVLRGLQSGASANPSAAQRKVVILQRRAFDRRSDVHSVPAPQLGEVAGLVSKGGNDNSAPRLS
jgi:hypothetical protein